MSLGKPLLSVVVSTYNRPYLVCEMLESLLRQTFQDFEVVLVNDHGTSIAFTRELYPELKIRIIDLPQNRKLVHAKNVGVTHASGEYIMLLDDDDAVLPVHMERMMAAAVDSDLVFSDTEIYDYVVQNQVRIPTDVQLYALVHDRPTQRKFNTFFSSGCIYRRDIHDTLGPFDEDMYHYWDWDFNLRVMERFEMKRVPVASALYALSDDGDNMSNDETQKRLYLDKLCMKHGLGELPTKTFRTLLDVPELLPLQAQSERLWDRQPIVSRLVRQEQGQAL